MAQGLGYVGASGVEGVRFAVALVMSLRNVSPKPYKSVMIYTGLPIGP